LLEQATCFNDDFLHSFNSLLPITFTVSLCDRSLGCQWLRGEIEKGPSLWWCILIVIALASRRRGRRLDCG
jgi:hypothetical protein